MTSGRNNTLNTDQALDFQCTRLVVMTYNGIIWLSKVTVGAKGWRSIESVWSDVMVEIQEFQYGVFYKHHYSNRGTPASYPSNEPGMKPNLGSQQQYNSAARARWRYQESSEQTIFRFQRF